MPPGHIGPVDCRGGFAGVRDAGHPAVSRGWWQTGTLVSLSCIDFNLKLLKTVDIQGGLLKSLPGPIYRRSVCCASAP